MKNLVIIFIFLANLVACKSKQDCMTPPPKINFDILKNGFSVSKQYQNTLTVYYLENGSRKNVDLQYTESADGKGGFYTSYFSSLTITTNRDFYLDLNNEALAYKIRVQLSPQNADCGTYNLEKVSLNGLECLLKSLDVPIYQLVL